MNQKLGLLVLYPKEMVTQIHKRMWSRPLTAVLFVVGKVGPSAVSSLGEWRGNMSRCLLWGSRSSYKEQPHEGS